MKSSAATMATVIMTAVLLILCCGGSLSPLTKAAADVASVSGVVWTGWLFWAACAAL